MKGTQLHCTLHFREPAHGNTLAADGPTSRQQTPLLTLFSTPLKRISGPYTHNGRTGVPGPPVIPPKLCLPGLDARAPSGHQ